ncbi:MAG: choice-of-anchor J domain-containing protein, partial [Clostridia bacterium]|nr:choice-of-anchor J domain-containing protein [Clostridia bacterium]
NWAISPAIELPEGTARVTLYAAGQDSGGYHLEHFAIYAGLTADPDEMMQISEIFVTAHDYAQFEADLSDFAGETVYIAIRHFDVTDMFILDVDQVEVWATPGEPQPPVEHLWGDANGDGEVNGEDVLLVMRYSMEIQELDPENIDPWCDVNQDGVCDMTDALLIARYVSEIIPELPVQG